MPSRCGGAHAAMVGGARRYRQVRAARACSGHLRATCRRLRVAHDNHLTCMRPHSLHPHEGALLARRFPSVQTLTLVVQTNVDGTPGRDAWTIIALFVLPYSPPCALIPRSSSSRLQDGPRAAPCPCNQAERMRTWCSWHTHTRWPGASASASRAAANTNSKYHRLLAC